MSTAVERLRSKLVKLSLVRVHGYPRVRNGKVEHVDGYTYFRGPAGRALAQGVFREGDFAGMPSVALDRAARVEEMLTVAQREGLATHQQYAVQVGLDKAGDPIYAWAPERRKVHAQLVEHFFQKIFGHVPTDGKAAVVGGLPGAGKSTLLRNHPNITMSEYGIISADDFKEALAERGMIPELPGLTPMEASPLVHEETQYLVDQLAQRAYDERKNMMWDVTMSSDERVGSMLDDLNEHGYSDITGLYVEIAPEVSTNRAMRRWWEGHEAYQRGERPIGGRYLPPAAIKRLTRGGRFSENRYVFERLKSRFNHWEVWSSATYPATLVSSSARAVSGVS